jgi:hypothetical protein
MVRKSETGTRSLKCRSSIIDIFAPAHALFASLLASTGWFDTPEPVKNWMPQPHGFCSCSPIGGPTEEEYHCDGDMGLTQVSSLAC